MEYSMQIEYVRGCENAIADALSRLDLMRGVDPGREERRGTRRGEAETRHERSRDESEAREEQRREQSRAERSESESE